MDSAPLMTAGAVLAAVVAAVAVPAIRRWTVLRGAVVESRADRWHAEATPALGGIGIFLAVLCGSVLVAVRSGGLDGAGPVGPGWKAGAPGLLAAGALMFVTGLVDDLRELGPAAKLTLQLTAATILVSTGFVATVTGVAPVDVVLSLAWCVAITNAVNLLDNMNGLAGGVALIAATCLGVLAAGEALWLQAAWAFALAGACLGFLLHNYPRARIFMGDSGSLFIGISLAAVGLSAASGTAEGSLSAVAVPVLVLSVPILDTALVTVSRLAEGRPVARGGRDHVSHRLVASGLADQGAVRLLWLLAGLSGAAALAVRYSGGPLSLLVAGVVLLTLATVAFHMLGVQVHQRAGDRTRLARILAAGRHWSALAVVLDAAAVALASYAAWHLHQDGTGPVPVLVVHVLICLALTLGHRCLVRVLDRPARPWRWRAVWQPERTSISSM